MVFAAVNVAHHLATFALMVLILHALVQERSELYGVGQMSVVGLAAASATMTLACAIACLYWVRATMPITRANKGYVAIDFQAN